MNAALWALCACFLAGIGARDQMLVAALTARLGRHGGLLLMGCITGAMACALAAFAAREIAGAMPHPARLVLACFALAAGGLESLLVQPRFTASEPTRSLFAAALVLLMVQAMDAARFLVLAIALASDAPVQAAVGGAAGTLFALVLGWLAAEALLDAQGSLASIWIVRIRRVAGGLLLAAGVALGLRVWLLFGA